MAYTTRTMIAWSFDRVAPDGLGYVSERFHTPVVAIGISTAGAIVFMWLIAYQGIAFLTLIEALLVVWGTAMVAAIVFPLDPASRCSRPRRPRNFRIARRAGDVGDRRASRRRSSASRSVLLWNDPIAAGPLIKPSKMPVEGWIALGTVVVGRGLVPRRQGCTGGARGIDIEPRLPADPDRVTGLARPSSEAEAAVDLVPRPRPPAGDAARGRLRRHPAALPAGRGRHGPRWAARPRTSTSSCRHEDRKGLRRLLEARGYEIDRDLLVAMEGRRYSFRHPGTGLELDVFVDRLEFCHTIELRDRLGAPDRHLPVEDLLLQKLQIVRHDGHRPAWTRARCWPRTRWRASRAPDGPDARGDRRRHVAGLLARDWGFHHTATANLAGSSATAAVGHGRRRGRRRADRRAAAAGRDRRRAEVASAGGLRARWASGSSGGRTSTSGGHVLMARLRRRNEGPPRSERERTIFFATDLHGSEMCFRKFVAAAGSTAPTCWCSAATSPASSWSPIVQRGRARWEAEVHGQAASCWTRPASRSLSAAPRTRAATPSGWSRDEYRHLRRAPGSGRGRCSAELMHRDRAAAGSSYAKTGSTAADVRSSHRPRQRRPVEVDDVLREHGGDRVRAGRGRDRRDRPRPRAAQHRLHQRDPVEHARGVPRGRHRARTSTTMAGRLEQPGNGDLQHPRAAVQLPARHGPAARPGPEGADLMGGARSPRRSARRRSARRSRTPAAAQPARAHPRVGRLGADRPDHWPSTPARSTARACCAACC